MSVLFVKVASIALTIALAILPGGAFSEENYCSTADSAIVWAKRIRGLGLKEKVPCRVHEKSQVKEYLLNAINTKIPPEMLAHEERIYKAVGFIPEDFDYASGLVDLYLSQIGGYYDPEKNHFVMAAWMPAVLQMPIAVHELTHALQDQHFNLEKFIDEDTMSSDELVARAALIEGDATAVMIDYSRLLMGGVGIAKEKNVEVMMLQNLVGAGLVGGMSGVPESVKMMLLFPYTSGLRFAHHLLRIGDYKKIDEAFNRAPRSSEEILHPEKYNLEVADFVPIGEERLKQCDVPADAQLVHSDTYGEFSISALLRMFTADSQRVARAAAGWGGDRIGLFETPDLDHVVWVIAWDTLADATEFDEAFRATMPIRFGSEPNVFEGGWIKNGPKTLIRVKKIGKEIEIVIRRNRK